MKRVAPCLFRAELQLNSALPEVETGDRVFAGLDLSASRDLTALVLVFPKGGKYHVVTRFWLPEDGLRDKAHTERIPWDVWAEQGYLTTISGPVIQPEVIAQAVAEVSQEYDLQLLAYDRWRINDIQWELDNLGAHVPMTPFGQGFKDRSPAKDKVEQFTTERKLCHSHNTILNMYAAVAVISLILWETENCTKLKATQKLTAWWTWLWLWAACL